MDNKSKHIVRDRSTKIIATMGPASAGHEMVEKLIKAGADVFRLNCSHGSHDDHRKNFETIREVEAKLGRPIGILADLQGPKLRVGVFEEDGIFLKIGDSFRLDLDKTPGTQERVQLPHPEIFKALVVGSTLLLDDGRIRLKVTERSDEHAQTEVMVGGKLSNRKGVNVPDVVLPLAALTPKDKVDLEFACELGVDWIALSFVQRADDLADARMLIKGRAALLGKIEKPSAVEDIDEIVAAADAVMVARGDLGVELPLEVVPGTQKRIIASARKSGKPVVVATQMLESMVQNPVPTRAEVSDVATAVYDGADAVMLSAESAVGAWPVEAVATMDKVLTQTEKEPNYRELLHAEVTLPDRNALDAIALATRQVARTVSAKIIVCYSSSGSTAIRVSRERPKPMILLLTPNDRVARKLSLAWGLHCTSTPDCHDFATMVRRACRKALEQGMVVANDALVITAGVPFGTPGATNILRIAWINRHGTGAANVPPEMEEPHDV